MELHGERTNVVLTGATGFVGGRLAEVLTNVRGVRATALVRDYARVSRIARLGIRIVRADLLSPASFSGALAGADVVFHCGYGGGTDDKSTRTLNLDGTMNLAREARRQGVRRFVHVSTMAIYGHDLPPNVTEATPPRPTTAYGRTKLEIEQELRSWASTAGFDVRIVRPTKVFGPYDYNFTVPTIQRLLAGRLWLIEDGSGVVSPNYVDNLVHGLLLSAETEGINGGAYIMADGVSLTWADFFRYFVQMTGAEPCGSVTRAQCEAATAAARRSPSAGELLSATLLSSHARVLYPKHALYRAVRGRIPQALVDRAKRYKATAPARSARTNGRPSVPSMNEYRDYARRGAFSIALAERELGYRPCVSLPAAMDRTAAWLHFAEFLPEAPPSVAAVPNGLQ